jgi:uncharacterized protein
MPRRIQEDHKMFRDVVGGTTRKELKKWIRTGRILRRRGKKQIAIPIPRIDLPRFIYGRPDEGVGRGPGDEGDVVHQEPGKGKGDNAGIDPGDAIEVDIQMEEILKMMQEDWQLPNMRPKPNQTYEEVKIKYNSLSKVGPPSLLHKRKTMLQTLKRMKAAGQLEDEHKVLLPGHTVPITPLIPISDDMRYRQWNEIKIPTSNAVIFFARDISGSMGPFKCDIVSDMSWWIDMWIRQFYDKTERVYVAHDSRAWEVDADKFYKIRHGGGTICSSALKHIAKQLKNRYPPETWNIYTFYFSDGENWMDDNEKFVKCLRDELGPDKVNLNGITQILPWGDKGLKEYVDEQIKSGKLDNKHVRTAGISRPDKDKEDRWGWWYWDEHMDEDERNAAIINAIRELLSAHQQGSAAARPRRAA